MIWSESKTTGDDDILVIVDCDDCLPGEVQVVFRVESVG
jgi:hypothetical protein